MPERNRPNLVFGSVTRITDLAERDLDIEPVSRGEWARGEIVAGTVLPSAGMTLRLELPSGRFGEPMAGDVVIGALGTRHATLELVGSWRDIDEDGRMEVITGGGVIGRTTSRSPFVKAPIQLAYRGHVIVDGKPARLTDWVRPQPHRELPMPVVMIVGTSMSAGKTTAAKVIIRLLREEGKRVVGAKLVGAGRYHDILSMRDAGAAWIYDFVDAGLPTTVVDKETFRTAARNVLSRIAATDADVAVIEAGASPLEPYRGDEAVAMLGESIGCMVLCASDPYAVVGIVHAFGRQPDIVTGIGTNTRAGIELIEKLADVPALNVRDPEDHGRLGEILRETVLGTRPDATGSAGAME